MKRNDISVLINMDKILIVAETILQSSSLTLSVVAGVDTVARQGDVLRLAVERLQEGHQVLVMGELLGDGEGHHHHVDGGVALREGAEQRGDRTVQLLHGAL